MALYHKHRPQTFASITGQEHIITTLQNQVANGTVGHAYLFSGPRGIGKTTSARVLAKAINCTERKEGEVEPCNTCTSCSEIAASRAIDVIEIDAASHTGVDHVREHIIDNAQFKPTKSKYKVFIIDEVHMLSTSAFNALLKTLEEPPLHVVFILATTELHKIPDTIISRCQRYHFKKIPYDTMKTYLKMIAEEEGITVDNTVLDRIIAKGDGCARDAVSLLDQLMATGDKKITPETATLVLPTSNREDVVAFITACIDRSLETGLQQLETLVDDGLNVSEFAHDTIEMLRVLLITSIGSSQTIMHTDLSEKMLKELRALKEKITPPELVQLIDIMLKRRLEITSAPLPQLPLEMALVEWCTRSGKETVSPASESQTKKIEIKKTEEEKEIKSTIPEKLEKPKTITERVKDFVAKDKNAVVIAMANVQKQWTACVQQLEKDSPSLVTVLKLATIEEVTGQTIRLGVPYVFHYDTLCDHVHKKKIEQILSDLLQTPVILAVSLLVPPDEQKSDIELQGLAAAFGGEIIT